jgi:hypothetical protein
MMLKLHGVAIAGLVFTAALGCRVLERGPSDEEVVAAVRKSPPAPPTLGPTYLEQVDAVEVSERGRFNPGDRSWPVRVRVRGSARIKVSSPFQLAVGDERSRTKAEPVEFVEEARFKRDGFGHWEAAYAYDPAGPRWRLEASRAGTKAN